MAPRLDFAPGFLYALIRRVTVERGRRIGAALRARLPGRWIVAVLPVPRARLRGRWSVAVLPVHRGRADRGERIGAALRARLPGR